MLVASCVEAARLFGLHKVTKQIGLINKDIAAFARASAKDDQVDEDEDGIADVQQISKTALLRRKALVAARAVNPERLSKALAGLYSAFTAIIATLRIQMSQAVTLGTVLGDVAYDTVYHVVLPPVQALLDPAYHKWLPCGLSWLCRGVGVWIAFWLYRAVNAFYSAVRGSQLMLRGLLRWVLRHPQYSTQLPPGIRDQLTLTAEEKSQREAALAGKVLPAAEAASEEDGDKDDVAHIEVDETSPAFFIAVWVLAVVGFAVQVRAGFSVPFPLNIVLVPFSMLEAFLSYFVTYSSYTTGAVPLE